MPIVSNFGVRWLDTALAPIASHPTARLAESICTLTTERKSATTSLSVEWEVVSSATGRLCHPRPGGCVIRDREVVSPATGRLCHPRPGGCVTRDREDVSPATGRVCHPRPGGCVIRVREVVSPATGRLCHPRPGGCVIRGREVVSSAAGRLCHPQPGGCVTRDREVPRSQFRQEIGQLCHAAMILNTKYSVLRTQSPATVNATKAPSA